MTKQSGSERLGPDVAAFITWLAVVLTVVMVLFPPFSSLTGIEYAFLLTGPEWSRRLGEVGGALGLEPRVHRPALLLQLVVVWAVALGARRYLAPRPRSRP